MLQSNRAPQSPMERVRDDLKHTDELEFLDKRNKQLSLDKEQKEKLKLLNKEMEEAQKPIFKDIEFAFKEVQRMERAGGGMGGPGGRGGGMPEGVRESMVKLTDIQRSYGDRAHEMMKPEQIARADTLRPVYLDELRELAAKKANANSRESFQVRRVGRGG
jgi:hypothetical protein